MKTVSAEFLNALNTQNIELLEKLYLYHQYNGKIISVDIPNNAIIVEGDATSLIMADDYILIPLKDFVNHILVISSVLNTNTTITLSGVTVDMSYVSLDVCLEINITDRILKDGFKDIVSQVEGNYLNDFDSGKMDYQLDNSTGYFYNKTSTGLLNSSDIFWCKYTMKIKGISDELIFFGGILENDELNNNAYDKVITIRVYGHSKELERYPASYIVKEDDELELIKISGMYIKKYTESEDSQEGIKQIIFEPFSESDLKGVEVESVSYDTELGIHKLEFRYPNFFKWSNGDWIQVLYGDLNSDGNIKLYAYDGGSNNTKYAIVNFGASTNESNNFPDMDTEMWVLVDDADEGNGEKKIVQFGKPILSYDGGEPVNLSIHSQRLIYYNANDIEYINYDYINYGYRRNILPPPNTTPIFLYQNDELIIASPNKFYGIEIFLSTFAAIGDVFTFSYSVGGNLFSAAMNLGTNGLIDGTDGLKNDGKITWETIIGWNANTINAVEFGNENMLKGYMIKIKQTTHVSTSIIFQEIRKLIRVSGIDKDYLDITINQGKLYEGIKNGSGDAIQDEIILRNDVDGWKFGIWYENISIKQLLDIALEKSNYDDSHQVIDDIKIIKNEEYFNIWGKPPRFNYNEKPTAMYYDEENDYVYIATKLDLWRCHITGVWEYLCIFANVDLTDSSGYLAIKTIWKKNNYIYCIADSDDNTYAQNYIIVYRYDILTEENIICTYGSNGYSGRRCIRDGGTTSWLGNTTRIIGTGLVFLSGLPSWMEAFSEVFSWKGGENLCLAYRQKITTKYHDINYAYLYLDDAIDSIANFIYYLLNVRPYNQDLVQTDKNGPFLNADMGYYCIADKANTGQPRLGVVFDYNQQGCIFKMNDVFYAFFNWGADEEHAKVLLTQLPMNNVDFMASVNCKMYDRIQIPISNAVDDINDIIYFGRVVWKETGAIKYYDLYPAVSYSYITEWKGSAKNKGFTKVWKYDNTDETTAVNNGSGISNVFTAAEQILYLGYINKFNQIKMNMVHYFVNNIYVFEYWNGLAWSALPETGDGIYGTALGGATDYLLSFNIPYDWQTKDVNGSELYYIRVRCTTWNNSVSLGICYMAESVLWDSRDYATTAYKHYMPTWMLKVDNLIYGCMFNKNSEGDYPFQWCIFVFNIDTGVLYLSHEGSNFTFDGSYSFKDFIYNEFNQTIYCVAENIRHKDKPSFLVKIEFNGTDITLTSLGSPLDAEWGNVGMAVNNTNGNIYGITRDKKYTLWEYAKEFYMRVEIAKFGVNENIRDVMGYIAELNNCNYIIHSERIIRFIKRDSDSGSNIDIEWGTNMQMEKPNFENWKHYYDSIAVQYQNLLDDTLQGRKRIGFDGWMKRISNINNTLVQNIHTAKLVSVKNYDYFNQIRLMPNNVKIMFLPFIEVLDGVSLLIPSKIADLDVNKAYKVIGMNYVSDKSIVLTLLERSI